MRFAQITNGKVVNIVLADAKTAQERGYVEVPPEVGVGWSYDGSTFTPVAANSIRKYAGKFDRLLDLLETKGIISTRERSNIAPKI